MPAGGLVSGILMFRCAPRAFNGDAGLRMSPFSDGQWGHAGQDVRDFPPQPARERPGAIRYPFPFCRCEQGLTSGYPLPAVIEGRRTEKSSGAERPEAAVYLFLPVRRVAHPRPWHPGKKKPAYPRRVLMT